MLREEQTTYIISPNVNDVLSGRGGLINKHPGNLKLTALVKKYKKQYVACPKPQKAMYSKLIYEEIRAMSPPGRFLKQEVDLTWSDIGEKKALLKIRQALREGAPELLKALGTDEGQDEFSTSPPLHKKMSWTGNVMDGKEPSQEEDSETNGKHDEISSFDFTLFAQENAVNSSEPPRAKSTDTANTSSRKRGMQMMAHGSFDSGSSGSESLLSLPEIPAVKHQKCSASLPSPSKSGGGSTFGRQVFEQRAEEVNQFQPSQTQFHLPQYSNRTDAGMQLQTSSNALSQLQHPYVEAMQQNQADHSSAIGVSNINNSFASAAPINPSFLNATAVALNNVDEIVAAICNNTVASGSAFSSTTTPSTSSSNSQQLGPQRTFMSAVWNSLPTSTSRLNNTTSAAGSSNINQMRHLNSSDMTDSLYGEIASQEAYHTVAQTFPGNNFASSSLLNVGANQGGFRDDATLDQSQLLQYQMASQQPDDNLTDSSAGGSGSIAQRWPGSPIANHLNQYQQLQYPTQQMSEPSSNAFNSRGNNDFDDNASTPPRANLRDYSSSC